MAYQIRMPAVTPRRTWRREDIQGQARHAQYHQCWGSPLSMQPICWQQQMINRRPLPWQLLARTSNMQEEQQKTSGSDLDIEEPLLSELDARVLRSMLQDEDKLDLGQEENMRRLLERGIGPKTAPPPKQEVNEDYGDSEYSSQVFKKLTDTKLWKVLKRTTEDLVESAKIFVINRIERDAKLLASVGLFAWDRAVRDVARALPAASSKARVAVGLLTNSSSIAAEDSNNQQPIDLFEELNTPLDEIKSVTQAITDILSGDVTMVDGGASGGRRRLRSLAPAGQGNNAERQRRAYQRRKKTTLQEEKEVVPNLGKVVGGLADATWEMKRELQVETSQPGYKTENLRNAIEAGATQTGRLLQAVKDEGWEKALLSPLKRQKVERRLKAAQQDKSTTSGQANIIPVAFLQNLMEERARVVSRLRKCIEQPEATWLGVEVIQRADGVRFEETCLRTVVETMIQARDELKTGLSQLNNDQSNAEMFDELRNLKKSIEQIQSKANELISPVVGDALFDELVGKKAAGDDPILLSLDELEDVLLKKAASAGQRDAVSKMVLSTSDDSQPARTTNNSPPRKEKGPRGVVDVMPEHRVSSGRRFRQSGPTEEENDTTSSFQVEIVTDDVFSGKAAKSTKTVEALPSEESEEPNFLVQATLRSLDVVFFVLEKVLLVAFPKLFRVGRTMSTRIDEVGRSGLGKKGWQRIGFTEEGARRY